MVNSALRILYWSERRKRTANGRQDGGDEKVIGDSDISVPGGEGDVSMMEC